MLVFYLDCHIHCIIIDLLMLCITLETIYSTKISMCVCLAVSLSQTRIYDSEVYSIACKICLSFHGGLDVRIKLINSLVYTTTFLSDAL